MLVTYQNLGLTLVVLSALVSSACGSRRESVRPELPTIETVCVVIEGVSEPGMSFAIRKTSQYLAEAGFRFVESGCDISTSYTAFNHGQWEVLNRTLFGTRSSNSWRTEGVIALRQGVRVVVEDERVDLRDYGTMQDLLDALAGSIADTVVARYRGKSPRKP